MNSHGFHGICNAIDHAKKKKTLANGDIKKKKKKKHYQCDCEFRDHLYKYHVSNINLVKKKNYHESLVLF